MYAPDQSLQLTWKIPVGREGHQSPKLGPIGGPPFFLHGLNEGDAFI